jgi:hypothetical protein
MIPNRVNSRAAGQVFWQNTDCDFVLDLIVGVLPPDVIQLIPGCGVARRNPLCEHPFYQVSNIHKPTGEYDNTDVRFAIEEHDG